MGDDLAAAIELRRRAEGFDVKAMLQEGEVDAAFGDATSVPVSAGPRVRLLDASIGRDVFADFYRRTGVVPVNHVLVAQRRLVEHNPALAMLLYGAFERSKQVA